MHGRSCRRCRGTRRSRSGRRCARAHGRASSRTACRTWPWLEGPSARSPPIPSSPSADGRRSREACRQARTRCAASRGRCRWWPASAAVRRPPARRGLRTRSGRGTPPAPTPRPLSSAGTAGPGRRGRAAARSMRACRRSRPRPPCARSRSARTPPAAPAGRTRASPDSRAATGEGLRTSHRALVPCASCSSGTISGD